MIKLDQKSFETKTVVKPGFSGEFVRLPVPVKHPWMCSVRGSVSEGESSNLCKEAGRSLSRVTITRKEMT